MKTLDQAVNELEQLVETKLPSYDIPFMQGRTIRIGKALVRRSKKHGYIVFDIENNTPVTTTFSKHGAVAVAKAYNKQQPLDKFIEVDKTVEKHYNDALFYSYNLNKTTSEIRRFVLQDRLDISEDRLQHAYSVLEDFILTIE